MGRKKGGGGKLNRSEILQARLNPKLRLAAEIMARSQRRTISSLIEILVEDAMKRNTVPVHVLPYSQINMLGASTMTEDLPVNETIEHIWTPDEADRFANFALFLPELLSPEEIRVWYWITKIPYFWRHFEVNVETKSGKLLPEKSVCLIRNYQGFIYERMREHWSLIKSILEGQTDIQELKDLELPAGKVVEKPTDYPLRVFAVDECYD